MSGHISRRRVLTTLGSGIVVGGAGCSELSGGIAQDSGTGRSIGERDESQPDEWTTLGQNPQNTKFNPGGAGPKEEPDIEWTYDVEYIFTPPVISDDSIVLSGIESLTTLNLDGTQRWSVGYSGVDGGNFRTYHYSVSLISDVVCSSTFNEDYVMELVGYNHEGDLLWEIEVDNGTMPETPFVTYYDDTLYVSTTDSTFSLDPSTGEVSWSVDEWFPSIIVTEDIVLGDTMVAYDRENGEAEWEFDTLNDQAPLRPVVADNIVYVQYGNDGIIGLNVEDGSISMEATDRFGGEFAFVDDVVIEPAGDTLRAYDLQADEVLWEQEYSAALSPPAVADGVAYVGGEDKRIRGVEIASGEELWSRQLDEDVMRPIVAQGRVLAVSGDTLYSLS